jgi:hypothetical protein
MQSPVDDQLRGDHERQRKQKPRVNLDIEKKRYWHSSESGSTEKGEDQQGHPTNEEKDSDPPRDKFQARPRKSCSKVQLVEWSSEH